MYNFSEFINDCNDLDIHDIREKVNKELTWAESIKTSRTKDSNAYHNNISYCSKLRTLSGILFNPFVITALKVNDSFISEIKPIILKINHKSIHLFLNNENQ